MSEHKFDTDSAYSALQDRYYQITFRNQENHFHHNPYNHEMRQVDAIERGDVDGLLTVLEEDFSSNHGTLAFNPLRQEIDIGIVCVTLASRAAIRGGLHYEKAFTLSDACIQLMESCRDVQSVKALCHSVQKQYAELVHECSLPSSEEDQKSGINNHIEHCKDYIFAHLHGRISVSEIAEYCGLTPNYLSMLFVRYEHITIKQYILNEKINLVQKMLTYSPYTYVEIAAYLGFASQSHMGAEFKKITGMTLRDYRRRYQKDDFLPDV